MTQARQRFSKAALLPPKSLVPEETSQLPPTRECHDEATSWAIRRPAGWPPETWTAAACCRLSEAALLPPKSPGHRRNLSAAANARAPRRNIVLAPSTASRLASRKRQQAVAVHELRESHRERSRRRKSVEIRTLAPSSSLAVFLIPACETAARARRVAGIPRLDSGMSQTSNKKIAQTGNSFSFRNRFSVPVMDTSFILLFPHVRPEQLVRTIGALGVATSLPIGTSFLTNTGFPLLILRPGTVFLGLLTAISYLVLSRRHGLPPRQSTAAIALLVASIWDAVSWAIIMTPGFGGAYC